jgi:suppressor for copper-sensitivity B
MKRLPWGIIVCAVLAIGLPLRAAVAADAASAWYTTDQGRVRLIAATPDPGKADPGGADTVTLGLQFELASHWKIYWRSPGDAGYPPALDWTGSQNLRDANIAWPAPERFSVGNGRL